MLGSELALMSGLEGELAPTSGLEDELALVYCNSQQRHTHHNVYSLYARLCIALGLLDKQPLLHKYNLHYVNEGGDVLAS